MRFPAFRIRDYHEFLALHGMQVKRPVDSDVDYTLCVTSA